MADNKTPRPWVRLEAEHAGQAEWHIIGICADGERVCIVGALIESEARALATAYAAGATPSPDIERVARETAEKCAAYQDKHYGTISPGYPGRSRAASVRAMAGFIAAALRSVAGRSEQENKA